MTAVRTNILLLPPLQEDEISATVYTMLQSVTDGRADIRLNVENDIERYRLQTLFSKEPETIEWIRELMRPGEVFYDIGANIGVYSLYAALFHKSIHVFAFEPAYHNFAKLCKNIIANKCQDTITPYCLGLAEKTHAGILNLSDARAGSAGHRVDRTTYRSGVGAASRKSGEAFQPILKQGIIAVTIDDLVRAYHLPAPHHLKIDIDGGEEEVLKGGAGVLQKTARSVLVEIDDKDGSVETAVRSFMGSCGLSADHSLNSQKNHSRVRRAKEGHAHIKNIIFTR